MYLDKCKFSFSFPEIKTKFTYWLEKCHIERTRDVEADLHEKEVIQKIHADDEKIRLERVAKINWRKQMSSDILKLKLQKHKTKLNDVFLRYAEK